MTSQNRKKKSILDKITCQTKLNPGPVKRINTVQAQRIINASISRVLCLSIGGGSIGFNFNDPVLAFFLYLQESEFLLLPLIDLQRKISPRFPYPTLPIPERRIRC